MSHAFLCSLGSNIEPELNFQLVRPQLEQLGQLYYSEVIYTKPVDINTQHDFLNGLFVIFSALDAVQLKQRFNEIEIALGRDRSDPDCSVKDRPMDIDILAPFNAYAWKAVPSYLHNLAEAFDNDLSKQLAMPQEANS